MHKLRFAIAFLAVLSLVTVPLHAASTTLRQLNGLQIGTETGQKVAFHGSAPVARRAGAAQTAMPAVTTAALTGSLTGTTNGSLANVASTFDATAQGIVNKNFKELQTQLTATVADLTAARTLINEMRAMLVEKGLMKGGS